MRFDRFDDLIKYEVLDHIVPEVYAGNIDAIIFRFLPTLFCNNNRLCYKDILFLKDYFYSNPSWIKKISVFLICDVDVMIHKEQGNAFQD